MRDPACRSSASDGMEDFLTIDLVLDRPRAQVKASTSGILGDSRFNRGDLYIKVGALDVHVV